MMQKRRRRRRRKGKEGDFLVGAKWRLWSENLRHLLLFCYISPFFTTVILRYQRSIKKGRGIKRAEMNNNTLGKKKINQTPSRTGFDKMFPGRETYPFWRRKSADLLPFENHRDE